VSEQHETYAKLTGLLDERGAVYRVIEHAEEGATEAVSALRGNTLQQAAKCIVVMVKTGKKTKRYALAVVPGDRRLDLGALKTLFGGTYAGFATPEVAERLAGSVSGTILPFSFDPELELVVDPALLEQEEIFFNAARLDRSLALRSSDYVAVAEPRTAVISQPAG
jgi:Ala-tRNA(Pro) deacylase